MGFNTTVLILNDALGSLEKDPNFNKTLHNAIIRMGGSNDKPIDVPIGNHANGGLVIESHHADQCIPILVGGNYGWPINNCYVHWNASDPELKLLEALAKKRGFRLVQCKRSA